MSRSPTRREFLRQSSAIAAACWVGSASQGRPRKSSANSVIRFACIGVYGQGATDREDAGRHGDIVALCDIDEGQLEKAALRFPKARKYVDFRKMYDEMADGIDAVTISTPDHTHAPAACCAMKLGKHCFCQKPLTHSVSEARLMRELAAEKKICTQMGNQGTAFDGLRKAVEIIRKGDLGAIKEVHIWTDRPKWPQGGGRPKEVEEIPKQIHWNLFLGPAKERPYNSAYQPFKWRRWLDFGTGALGDMACHTMNMSVMALQLFNPISIEANPDPEWTGDARSESYPKHCTIKYEFGPRGSLGPCTLYWYDGGKRPPEELLLGEKHSASGSLVIGEKGRIFSSDDYHNVYQILPASEFTDYKKPEIPTSPGHFTEFANAIMEGKPELAKSNFDYAGRLCETVLLGNVALQAGKKIDWDGVKMKVTNDADANRLVTGDYRKGWEL